MVKYFVRSSQDKPFNKKKLSKMREMERILKSISDQADEGEFGEH